MNMTVSPAPAFADPVLGSQETFRAALHAMSYPGRLLEAGFDLDPPAPLHKATAALALALFDFETPIWLDRTAATENVRAFLAFHCGCPVVEDPAAAKFAIVTDAETMPSLDCFNAGTDEAPETAATVILQVSRFIAGSDGIRLTGPGIDKERVVLIDGVPRSFWKARAAVVDGFPRGIDLFLTEDHRLTGLPRTTRIVS